MELWIRSQDKTALTKINSIGIENDKELVGYGHICVKLGAYETKTRSLEVLDEIQNILKPKYILDSSSIRPDGDSWVENGVILQNYNANARIEELSTYVYEMPKE